MAESQMDDTNVICPHCLHSYQAEAEDFDETEREEECEKCGGRYILYDEFTVTHHTRPVNTSNTPGLRSADRPRADDKQNSIVGGHGS